MGKGLHGLSPLAVTEFGRDLPNIFQLKNSFLPKGAVLCEPAFLSLRTTFNYPLPDSDALGHKRCQLLCSKQRLLNTPPREGRLWAL